MVENETHLVKKMKVETVSDPVEGVWREVVVGRLEREGQLLVPGGIRTLGDGCARAGALVKESLQWGQFLKPFLYNLRICEYGQILIIFAC